MEEPLWQECLGHQQVDSTPVSSEGMGWGTRAGISLRAEGERGAGGRGADAWPWAGAEV